MTVEQMLREFHESMQAHNGFMPESPTTDIPGKVLMSRYLLMSEEFAELTAAMNAGDLVKVADGLADVVYTVVGTAIVYGIPFDKVFAEVHRSNMTKTNSPDLAKLVKGPDYEPPRIAEILEAS